VLTVDAGEGGLEEGDKVSLAGVGIDEAAYGHTALGPSTALSVHVFDDVRLTANVEVTDDAPTRSHATVRRRTHENHLARTTARMERLVNTEVTRSCHTR